MKLRWKNLRKGLTAKSVCMCVMYAALAVAAGTALDGNIAFGLFVGALYSVHPVVAATVYLGSSAVFGVYNLLQAGVRTAVMMLFVTVHRIAKRKIGKLPLLLYLTAANVFYIAYAFKGYFDLFDRFVYAACGIAFAYVSIYTFRALFVRGLNYRPAADEAVCMGIFCAVASYCLSLVSFGRLELIYFVVPAALLFAATCLGDRVCLCMAVLAGIGNILATGEYGCCVYCAVAALMAVTLGKVSRYLAAVGVLAADILLGYFLNLHGGFDVASLAPTFASALVFAVVPGRVYAYIRDYCSGSADRYLSQSVVQKMGDTLSRRLLRLSDIFLSMKNAFFTMSAGTVSAEEAQRAIVRQCSDVVCKDCPSRTRCWRQDMRQTEQSLLNLTTCAVKRGKCTILDVPQALTVRCDRVSALLSEVNAQSETYRGYRERAIQADKGKALLGEQMGGVSDLLMQLADETKNRMLCDSTRESELVEKLVFHNILCCGAVIARQKETVTVALTVSAKDTDTETIEKVVGSVLKQNVAVERIERTDSDAWVNVLLAVKPRYSVSFGVSSVPKQGNEVSGDTHTVTRTDNGKCIIALCDGMGSGAKAEKMSATSIELVESFYRAGFDNDTILSCVNKLLVGSGNEIFCAVDMVVLDLYNGLADFIKLGSCSGLVRTEGKVQIVNGSSLPLGVLEEMTPSVTKKALIGGDIVVLMSDGVADCFRDPELIAREFAQVSLCVPQSIAETLMSKALKQCGGTPTDDMTVVVAKLA